MKTKIKYYEICMSKSTEAISQPEVVFKTIQKEFNPFQEDMWLLVLDIKNKIIKKHLLCRGHHNAVIITPSDIFRIILLSGGINFILAHNHPSGELEPSPEDLEFNKKTIEASKIMGLKYLDHIIFTNEKWYSFNQHNFI